MKYNTLQAEPGPDSCAEGLLTASKHLLGSKLGEVNNTVSGEYAEKTVKLSRRAKPSDCANCIGKLCMLNADPEKVNGTPVEATHTLIIRDNPRPKEAYDKLEEQALVFELREEQERKEHTEQALALAKRGFTDTEITELGLPPVDLEAHQDLREGEESDSSNQPPLAA